MSYEGIYAPTLNAHYEIECGVIHISSHV